MKNGASLKTHSHSKEPRSFCTRCLKSARTCLCSSMIPFDSDIKFVFLMHRKEQRDRLGTGTGRLSHLMLKNSQLFVGFDFERNAEIKNLLQNSSLFPCVLYPEKNALDISSDEGIVSLKTMSAEQSILVFVLDGSWSCVRKLIKANPSIAKLPRISFSTGRKSNFGFKKQPTENCLSTLEATHEIICLLENALIAFPNPPGSQKNLLAVFEKFVSVQSKFANEFRTEITWPDQHNDNGSIY